MVSLCIRVCLYILHYAVLAQDLLSFIADQFALLLLL